MTASSSNVSPVVSCLNAPPAPCIYWLGSVLLVECPAMAQCIYWVVSLC